MLDNAEDVMHSLEEFSKLKPKVIPRELEDYLGYVAKTGDPVFKWCMVKYLFREKMLSVINDFYEDTLTIELPPCPNVDAFNYDGMKTSLLERLESFHGAPFTIQRICELLTNPRKEYNRADKFMRAIEKNILVVSTREPGRYSDLDCETTQECSINGIREVGDSLDSTFIINEPARGPGPDSSSPDAELSDPMPDANHLNTVERVSPVHDQDVSSDSDDSSLENEHLSVDGSSEKTNGLDNEQITSFVDEQDGANVSSTDMTLPLEDSGEVRCDEGVVNPVSSSHESVIATQQMTFIASPNLGEVMGNVEGAPVDSLEPCLLSDGSLLNEVISEPSTDSSKNADKAESISEVSKSDDLNTPEACDQSVDPLSNATSDSNIVSVECDTSQDELNIRNNDCSETPDSVEESNGITDVANEQVTPCDTTGASSTLESGYFGSSQVQNEVSPSCDVPSELPLPDVQSDNAQSNIIDQSESISSNVPQKIVSPDNSTQMEDPVPSETSGSNLNEHCDYFPRTQKEEQPEITNSGVVSEAGDASEPIPQINDPVQSNVDQIELVSSESCHLNNVEQSISNSQSVVSSEQSGADQSCAVVSSEDIAPSEPMAQSGVINQSSNQSLNECLPNDNEQLIADNEVGLVNQTEQEVTQMDIPSDSEIISSEPAQSIQQDSIDSEPMDIDE